jgi:hypothetical protein
VSSSDEEPAAVTEEEAKEVLENNEDVVKKEKEMEKQMMDEVLKEIQEEEGLTDEEMIPIKEALEAESETIVKQAVEEVAIEEGLTADDMVAVVDEMAAEEAAKQLTKPANNDVQQVADALLSVVEKAFEPGQPGETSTLKIFIERTVTVPDGEPKEEHVAVDIKTGAEGEVSVTQE